MGKDLKIFTGNSNPQLAREICEYLQTPLGKAEVFKFSNDNTFVKINESVRGADVFVIQSFCYPVNDNLMELLIMIDALHRASAWRITAVIPYYAYSRSDKKDQPRVPITAKLVANLITVAGADRVLTIDLHAGQIQGFFDIPVDHLYSAPIFVDYFSKLSLSNFISVAPDTGRANRTRAFAVKLNIPLAIVDKRRSDDATVRIIHVIGDVKDKNAIIFDDEVDTAGTLVGVSQALKESGARDIYAGVTHPILCGSAVERIEASPIKELVVTNTISLGNKKCPKIKVLSVGPLLGETIRRIHQEASVTSLFT